jgi:hypothetical protein
MRLKPVPVLCLVLFSRMALAAPSAEWKEFSSQEGRFSVLFPSAPKQTTQTMTTKVGNLDARLYTLSSTKETPFEAQFFAVAYIDYPKDALAKYRTDALLDGAREGAVTFVKGKQLAETRVTQNGVEGREIKITAPNKRKTSLVVVRLFLVGERLYQVLVVIDESRAESGEIAKFLDSFKLEK